MYTNCNFLAGYALLYLLRHPDAQLKMQLELDKVCGDSLPSMDDRSRHTQMNLKIAVTFI